MSSCALDSYWSGRIEKVKALLEKYDDALLALASGAQSYELDTGPGGTRVRKTAADLEWLKSARDALANELATLDARVNGASTNLMPGF